MNLKKDVKGISIMIGYILLISMAVVMSIVIYQWLKTYIPTQGLDCPSDTSLFVKNNTCDSNELSITLKNSGKFNVSGYIIRASTEEGQEVATESLAERIISGGENYTSSSVLFEFGSENSFGPDAEATHTYNIAGLEIYFLEIIPIRFQTEDNKFRVVTCTNRKIKEEVTC